MKIQKSYSARNMERQKTCLFQGLAALPARVSKDIFLCLVLLNGPRGKLNKHVSTTKISRLLSNESNHESSNQECIGVSIISNASKIVQMITVKKYKMVAHIC